MFFHSSESLEMPNYEMIVISFDDEKRVGEVLDTQKQVQDTAIMDIKTSTVTVRNAAGKVTVKKQ